jgi:predicted nuclease with RNAse H fold
MKTIAGIDFGSKLAGTTVVALGEPDGCPELFPCAPKKDADRFLKELLLRERPGMVFIDAPLSLPGVYRFPDRYADYFFREADRALRAMSPMFLGGLTARAMQLKDLLANEGISAVETYPGYLAEILGLKDLGYKGKSDQIEPVQEALRSAFPALTPLPRCRNWHEIDALLAFCAGVRWTKGQHLEFGLEEEGRIFI